VSAAASRPVGADAVAAKGWLAAHRWLLLRRTAQLGFLAIFLVGPWAGFWLVKGSLASSRTLDTLPLTDPLVLLQTALAGHWPEATALTGAALVLGAYLVVGGRTYCSWVCPINPVTDLAHWLSVRLGLPKGWQPRRRTRLALLAMALLASALTGTVFWELVNPVTMAHRALVLGGGAAWPVVGAVFLLDLLVSRRGWCGHLCPVGAFWGQVNRLSLVKVGAANRAACNNCMDCYAVCPEPHVIAPALKGADKGIGPLVLDVDCTNCGRCIDVCSVDVYRLTHRFDRQRTPAPAPAAAPAE
jgi:ferredoxin-type protein NapH